jgi:ankyrin repeat protein
VTGDIRTEADCEQWAAINNHYALCHFLIQAGAPINAKGGDAVATPVLWAAKRCNYYIVNLLLDHGADPLLTDDQGFNLLHSATLDGNVYQIVLLLHQDIPVDIPDPQSHTPLMWAAYKGYSSCVDLFLRWGANVYATDDQGFTALHWALVKGSQGSIQKLLEYGADRFAKNNDGKSPAVTADEMNTTRQWHRALSEAGFDNDANPLKFPIPGVNDLLLAVCDSLHRPVSGQLLPGLGRNPRSVDRDVSHAACGAEVADLGAFEYAEYAPHREFFCRA